MKQKTISYTEWGSVILPNSGTSFSTISPAQVVNGPFFAYSCAGVPACVSGPSVPVGTIFASRYGSPGTRIKTYEWLVYGRVNDFLIQDVVEKDKIPDHYAEGIPSMFIDAPESIRSLFKK